MGYDQLVPTNNAGTNFILIRGNGSLSARESAIVVATQDNTEIFIDGSATAVDTIDEGEHYIILGNVAGIWGNNNMNITTSLPAFVYQTTSGINANNVQSMNLIPPINLCSEVTEISIQRPRQFGSGKVGITVPIGTNTLVTPTGGGTPFTIGPGQTVDNTTSNVTGEPGWFTHSYTLPSGVTLITVEGQGDGTAGSENPVNVGFLGGSGVRGAAGYFAGFGAPPSASIDLSSVELNGNSTTIIEEPIDAAGELSVSFSFDIELVGNCPSNVSIDWEIVGGTATEGQDYTLAAGATSGTKTFVAPGGVSTQVVNLPAFTVKHDLQPEFDETIILKIFNPVNAQIALAEVEVVIGDNDSIISVVSPEDSTLTVCDTTFIGAMADSVQVCGGGSEGTSTVNGTCIDYTPNANYIGNDTVCYIACNDGVCDTTYVAITVGPSVTDTMSVVLPEDSTLTLCDTNLISSQADSVQICGGGSGGTSTITGTCIDYTPNANYIGNDTVCYIVCNDGICDTTYITITVGPGVTDTMSVVLPEDSTLTLCDTNLIGAMADSVQLCGGGSGGTSSITGNCIDYTPNANYIGNDTVCYIVCNDGICDTTYVTITVGPGVTDTMSVVLPEDSTLTLCDTNLIGATADSVQLCGGGSNGTSSITGNCIDYTPNANYIGNDTVCYIVCNDGICDTTYITITVGPGVTDTMSVVLPEDSTLTLCDTNLIGAMADSVQLCGGGSNGTSTITGNCIDYTPTSNYVGNDTVCYIVCNDGICDTTYVTITVGPGVTDTMSVILPEDSTLTLCDTNLIGAMADSVQLCGGGSNGTGTITGNCIDYTPSANYIGIDTVCYIVCNDGVCDTTYIVITVGPGTNDTLGPIPLADGSDYTLCDSMLNNLLADSVMLCGSGSNGNVQINGNCFTYTSDSGYSGTDTVCYIVCNDGICDTTYVIFSIDQAPKIYCKDSVVGYLDSNGILSLSPEFLTDSIVDNYLDTTWLSKNILTCSDIGTNFITTYTIDSTGLTDSCQTMVVVMDTISPWFECIDDKSITIENTSCNFEVPNYFSEISLFTDNCDSANIVFTQSPAEGTIIEDISIPVAITLSAKDGSDNLFNCVFYVEVECADNKVIVPEVISPNGDGKNDVLVINGIENYEGSSIKIINRWGSVVYEAINYKNDWDGTSQKGIIIGENKLPVGTYFYVLDLGDGSDIIKGYFYLIR